ncbi:L10-interacting MYB domain-containing protein-like [Telopea speciosissima]|uniref:L10-interacting MYB domain-containing protein-like n=1 Tax=Telopea speciosissima TaxID=54955 RepID=UPI001CC5DE50|nr:L10-interacting MYB domain-containing protein-like [Telopea speciosissima]
MEPDIIATSSRSKGKSKVGPGSWSTVEVALLVRLMVDNVRAGNKSGATLSNNGWDDIHTRLETTLGRVFDRKQIRNKFNKMRIEYGSFKSLLQTTGFGWNSFTQTVTVDDDSVWDKAIVANSGWKKFRHQSLAHWSELQIIFGDSYAILIVLHALKFKLPLGRTLQRYCV